MASTAYLLNSGAQAIPRGPNELAETVRRRVRCHFEAFSQPFLPLRLGGQVIPLASSSESHVAARPLY